NKSSVSATSSKIAPTAATEKPDEKKPAEAVKTATDGKAAPTAATEKPDEKKPAEAVKTATDSKAAPTATTEKPDEKKPAEGSKVVNFPAQSDNGKGKADQPAAPTEDEYNDPKDVKLSIGADEKDRVTMVRLTDLHMFEGHPFKVEDNEDMMKLAESVKQLGVMEPIVAIPREAGGLEIVSGHRRHRAAELAGLSLVPVIVRDLDRDEATITMVDANLKRENISPMEKARAYSMRLEAMKRKAGRRSKTDILTGKEPIRADEELAQQTGESRATIQRLTRLTKLEPELQKMVDDKKLPVNTAADLSYLKKDEQKQVADAIKKEDKVPSGAQAAELKKDSQAGKLTTEKIQNTVAPTKKEMQPTLKVTLTEEELRPYFPNPRTTVPDVKSGIFDALKLRKAALERQQAKAAQEKEAAKGAKSTAKKTAPKR
ncbi:MAG: ParB/RepB/Spo0J family partition protein, partial [Oscillospiraceae bacterium]|nr:ParB/RepB/Spo0J family partition protein [Oscillospiraceae bacterium]